MKLKDFDFRIWDKNYTGCDNKNCKCQSNFIYGEEAKIRLSEFNNDAEIELWTGYFDNHIYKFALKNIFFRYLRIAIILIL